MTRDRFKHGWLALVLVALLGAPVLSPTPATGNRQPGAAAPITAAELREHVRTLASEELEGRGTGSEGARLAAAYIQRQFQAAGLRRFGDEGTYLQEFPFRSEASLGDGNHALLTVGRRTTELTPETDFMPLPACRNGRAAGEVVFVGYGISEPELGHDDYAGMDVRGKLVLAFSGSPDGRRGGPLAEHAGPRAKALTALRLGAAGLLLCNPPRARHDDLGSIGRAPEQDVALPSLTLKRPRAEALLAAAGRRLEELQEALGPGRTQSFPLPGARVEFATSIVRVQQTDHNVVGVLPGSDERLKEEYVVLGAHYDHVGIVQVRDAFGDERSVIHPGADDNASGTAGLIALARWFRERGPQPRSLIFVAFSGEELGLIGSDYFVREPPVPLNQIVAMLNFDMIGRSPGGAFSINGRGTSPEWPALVDEVNREHRLRIAGSPGGSGPSDQRSFYRREIPVLFFFTGTHADYHQPTDTWDKLEYESMAAIANFAAELAEKIAALPRRPGFRRVGEAGPQVGGIPVYLGTVPDYVGQHPDGLLLEDVRRESPAEKAGMRAGDVIVEAGGKAVLGIEEYTEALRAARPGVPLRVVVLRGEQRLELTVIPAAPGHSPEHTSR